jgi:hypothetical protein
MQLSLDPHNYHNVFEVLEINGAGGFVEYVFIVFNPPGQVKEGQGPTSMFTSTNRNMSPLNLAATERKRVPRLALQKLAVW